MIDDKNLYNYTGYVTIRQDDWGYPYTMVDMANRIISDWKFDDDCMRRSLNRERYLQMDGDVL